MPNSVRFKDISLETAANFLQSVVVVDDEADFSDANHVPPHALETPSRSIKPLESPSEPDTPYFEKSTPKLDAKLLIDTFAERGMVCSVLKPRIPESFEARVQLVASRADIVVLDWLVQGQAGEDAEGLLNIIVKAAKMKIERLQLVAIYTADNEFDKIKGKIENILIPYGDVSREADGWSIMQGATKICIFAKEHNNGIIPLNRKLPVEKLPDRLIEEYAAMTRGLLSNAALASLSVLRVNTHRIIRKFSSDLDAPFLTHRALLQEHEEAEDYLVTLIGDEIHSILKSDDIGKNVNLEFIESWVSGEIDRGKQFICEWNNGTNYKELSSAEVINLIETSEDEYQIPELPKNRQKLELTKMFCSDEKSGANLDEKFAYVTTMRAFYDDRERVLTQGTILKKDESAYLVCIQPGCDCLRIKKPRCFLFLPLTESSQGKPFNVVLKQGNNYIHLQSANKAFDMKLISFPPGEKRRIMASTRSSKYYFRSCEEIEYEWMGELKLEHTLQLVHAIVMDLSRVALNESEWLRRWSGKKHD